MFEAKCHNVFKGLAAAIIHKYFVTIGIQVEALSLGIFYKVSTVWVSASWIGGGPEPSLLLAIAKKRQSI